MNYQLIITEKRTGNLWDCAPIVEKVELTTERTGSPGTLKFTLIKAGDISFVEGDEVVFSVDGQRLFYGWVFTKSKDRWGVIDVTCYDRIRYLKANASYNFYGLTAGEILTQIAEDFALPLGQIEDTGYKIPSLIEQDKSCIDMINDALNQTLLNTNRVYVFFDTPEGLCLRAAENMISDVLLGDRSLVTDYTYKTDIDQQTYNSVKLVQPNKETGKGDVYEAVDSGNIGRWGLLRLYQQVDEDLNQAQIKAQAEATLRYYNRRLRTLSLESIGVVGLRAGQMVYVRIQNLGDVDLSSYVLIDRASHTFENDTHTMSLDLYEL